MRHVFKLGPLTDGSPRCLYLALHDTREVVEVEADTDLEGLRALQAQNLGPLTCDEDLADAARTLGLPTGEPSEEAQMQCAAIAMMTGNPLLCDVGGFRLRGLRHGRVLSPHCGLARVALAQERPGSRRTGASSARSA